MDANSLRYNILVAVDSLFEGTAPGYNDKQISSIINRAQRRVFRNKARLFDTDERVKRMLSPLLSRGSLVKDDIVETTDTSITDYPHDTSELDSVFYTLPSEAGFLVEEYVKLEIDDVATDPIIVLPITYDYFTKNYMNRYKKPSSDPRSIIWRMDSKLEDDGYVVELIYPNTHTVNDYLVSYLRYPGDITVSVSTPANAIDCEVIDQSFQDEIIGEAVKIITASLNETSYDIAATEKKFDDN